MRNPPIGFKTTNAKWIYDGKELGCYGDTSRFYDYSLPTPEALWNETSGYYLEIVNYSEKWWKFWEPIKTRIIRKPFYWYYPEKHQAENAIREYLNKKGKP